MEPNYHQGYWNGQNTAKFRIVVGVVADTPTADEEHFKKSSPGTKRYPWYKAYLGTHQQMVEIHYNNSTWYISNIDGSGLYKVTKGMGSPNCPHSSIYCESIIYEVPVAEWNHRNEETKKLIDQEVDQYWSKIDPEGWVECKKQMDSLRKMITRMDAMAKGKPLCEHPGCEQPATHMINLIIKPFKEYRLPYSPPKMFACSEHSDLQFSDVVSNESWIAICESWLKHGKGIPSKEFSYIEILPIKKTSDGQKTNK